MSRRRNMEAHHGVIREVGHEPLAEIARNAGDDDGWFRRIHSVWVFGLLRRRLGSPWQWRHGRISGGAEIGIVQINIALKSLHAIAISLAGNCIANLRLYRIPR